MTKEFFGSHRASCIGTQKRIPSYNIMAIVGESSLRSTMDDPSTTTTIIVDHAQDDEHQECNTNNNSATLASSYTELKIEGPPLYNQGVFTTKRSQTIPNVPPPLSLHADTTALLIVDVQPQYWSQCPAVRQDFPNFPTHMQNLIRMCRQRGAPILWVYADYRFDHSPWLKQFNRLHQGRIPPEVHFDDKTGWESFAQPLPHEPTIAKSSWSSTSSTKLLTLLKQMSIDTVLVCGLITSVCVQHSAFGVFEAGYRTILVTDACADRGLERHKAALALYGDYMYELKTTGDLVRELLPVVSSEESSEDDDTVQQPRRKRSKTTVVG